MTAGDERAFKKIRKVLEFVWESPYSSFYRDKYKRAGINLLKDVNSMEDFRRLPLLAKEEVYSTNPYSRFFLPKEKITGCNFSGGTTGARGPLVMLRSSTIKYPYAKKSVKRAVDLKVTSAMTVLFAHSQWAAENRFLDKSIKHFVCDVRSPASTAAIAKDLGIDALGITPTSLEALIPHLKNEGLIENIKYLRFGGEYCSRQRFEYFRKVFKHTYFDFGYNFTEARVTGYSCDFLNSNPRNIFHPLSDYLYYETIDPEDRSELVVSHLHTKTEFPLIRYRTGDMVNIYREKCPCGRSTKMKVFGRLGMDIVKVGGNNVYRKQIDEAIYPFGKYLSSWRWRLLIQESKKKKFLPRLILELVPKKQTGENRKFRHTLERAISEKIYFLSGKTLSELVEGKIYSPLEVKFVALFEGATKQKSIVHQII